MMNDSMDLDINALFEDGTVLSLPSRPPPRELFQRVDDLRGSGCCQKVAWSRWGAVAAITQNGTNLEFRNLRCHPFDGSWDLGDATIPPMNLTPDGVPFQHLCWSPNGSDLAAIDAAGRVSMFTMSTFLNTPNIAKGGQTDPAEDLNAVVGAYWLNLLPMQQRPPVINSLAIKTDKTYRYEMAQAGCFGPCHPNPQRSALVCLTTNGSLRLVWPQSDNKWHETVSEIESIVSSNDLITHAAICADKNQTLLVAFATTTKQLRTVRVNIKWGNKQNEKAMLNVPVIVNPSISIAHLAVTNWMDGTVSDEPDSFHIQTSMVTLSHLELIPPTSEGPVGPMALPTIVVVRSCLPTSPSHFNQDIHSTIDRWELRESPQPIHPAFEILGSRRRNSASQAGSAITLRKLDGFTVNKVVIFIQAINLDRVICFAYSDGSFEYRERASLAETFTEGNLDRFTHLTQIGFAYDDDEPCLQIALSPTNCSFVQIGCDKKLKWRSLRHPVEQIGASADDAQYAAVIAGLTMSLSAAILSSISYDDILAIAHRYTNHPTFSFNLLCDVSRVLKFHVDYSEESHHDTLIRNPSIQVCLSVLHSLGYSGDTQPRNFGAKLALISLQIRNCVVLMTMATSMKVPDGDHPQKKISGLEDADAIRILAGSVRWCLDLMAWLVDSLLHPDDGSIFKGAIAQAIDIDSLNTRLQTSNNVALHLLLSSASRGFLTAICRRLTHLDYTARKAMATVAQSHPAASIHIPQTQTSNDLRAAYTTIATLTSSSIVQIRLFENFLLSVSASVKDAYTHHGLASSASQTQAQQASHTRPTETPRNSAEQTMLFGGPLPAALVPAIRHIFTTLLPELRRGTDQAKLFFHDYSLLALDPPKPSSPTPAKPDLAQNGLDALLATPESKEKKDQKVARTIDIFQRTRIVLGQDDGGSTARETADGEHISERKSWRRCARCAAVMENFHSKRPAVNFLIMQQRRCFCGGNWDILTGRQIVA